MRRRVYRSLDRPASVFGIKGRFMILMGLGAALSTVAGIVVGKLTGMLGGVATVIAAVLASYFATTSVQSRIDEKDIWKVLAKRSFPDVYRVRPKPLRTMWKGFNLTAGPPEGREGGQ